MTEVEYKLQQAIKYLKEYHKIQAKMGKNRMLLHKKVLKFIEENDVQTTERKVQS